MSRLTDGIGRAGLANIVDRNNRERADLADYLERVLNHIDQTWEDRDGSVDAMYMLEDTEDRILRAINKLRGQDYVTTRTPIYPMPEEG